MSSFPQFDILDGVAKAARLKEGSEGVRFILWLIYQHTKLSTKQLARMTQIPLPVISAVLNELKNISIVERAWGTQLTTQGLDFTEKILSFRKVPQVRCPQCVGKTLVIPEGLLKLVTKLEEYLSNAPANKTILDQARCTAKTSLLRALYLLDEGDLTGKHLLFLGDNDLTVLACALLASHLNLQVEFTVIDIDVDLIQFLREIKLEEGFSIELILHDLREPLPVTVKDRFDVIITDPPYTLPGVLLFLSRGIESLAPSRGGKSIYLSFNARSDQETYLLQQSIFSMRLFFKRIIPAFNTYIGAEILGNVSQFTHLKTLNESEPLYKGKFSESIYTGELNVTKRIYMCINCGTQIKIGIKEKFTTIEELKSLGCPKCQTVKFRLLKRAQKNSEINDICLNYEI